MKAHWTFVIFLFVYGFLLEAMAADLCALKSCRNGDCIGGRDDYVSCECEEGFNGKFCNVGPCNSCNEDETCVQINGTAKCMKGDEATMYQKDMCELNPCLHSTDCIGDIEDFFCICKKGYHGMLCDIGPCNCDGDETCLGLSNGTSECQDLDKVKVKSDMCNPNPCPKNGKCFGNHVDYTCLFEDNFFGKSDANKTSKQPSSTDAMTSTLLTETTTAFTENTESTSSVGSTHTTTKISSSASPETSPTAASKITPNTSLKTSLVTISEFSTSTQTDITDNGLDTNAVTASTLSQGTRSETSHSSTFQKTTFQDTSNVSLTTIPQKTASDKTSSVSLTSISPEITSDDISPSATAETSSAIILNISSDSISKVSRITTAHSTPNTRPYTTELGTDKTSKSSSTASLSSTDNTLKSSPSTMSESSTTSRTSLLSTDATTLESITSKTGSTAMTHSSVDSTPQSSPTTSEKNITNSTSKTSPVTISSSSSETTTQALTTKTTSPVEESESTVISTFKSTFSTATSTEYSNSTKDGTDESMNGNQRAHAQSGEIGTYFGFGLAGLVALIALTAYGWYIRRVCKERSHLYINDNDSSSGMSESSNEGNRSIV